MPSLSAEKSRFSGGGSVIKLKWTVRIGCKCRITPLSGGPDVTRKLFIMIDHAGVTYNCKRVIKNYQSIFVNILMQVHKIL